MEQITPGTITQKIDTYVFDVMRMGKITKTAAVMICKQYHPEWFAQLASLPEAATNPYVKCKY